MNPDLRTSSAHVFVDDIESPALHESDVHHLRNVLRVRDDEAVSASDGRGAWRMCTFNGGRLDVASAVLHDDNPAVATTVAIVPLKGDRTESAIEKLVEVGIDTIAILWPTDHAVVKWTPEKMAANIERYRRVARAAAMQSRRVWLPTVTGPHHLGDVINEEGVAVADPSGAPLTGHERTIVIGPEGGFSVDEVRDARARVALGTHILRADTAAVVAGTLMVATHARATGHTG